jgi:nondiscriminating aspartyl-tRNA synthetase
MTMRVLTSELGHHAGEGVSLSGWVHRVRELPAVTFVVLRDRSGLAQLVLREPTRREQVRRLAEETVVTARGAAVANPAAPGGVEVVDPVVDVLGPAQPPPVELWRPALSVSLPTLLDHAAVTLRHPARAAVFRMAAASVAGFRATLDAAGFTEVTTPKIVAAATESGATVFGLDYFGRPAFLAQSPQFYKQTMVGVFERVYETGPVFRAEPHDTARHLASYTSLDAELGFIDDHRDVLVVLRDVVAGMLDSIRTRVADYERALAEPLPDVPAEMPSLHFADAQPLIAEGTGVDPTGEPDLSPAHERWLGEWARREHGSDFVVVTGYPMAKRPFYTHPEPGRPEYSNSFDLLFRGLELVTGGQRLHRYADYLAALAARGESPEPYAGYLEAFRHGMPPHGGFAIGLERWVARLTGASNVREVTLFPRDLQRLSP